MTIAIVGGGPTGSLLAILLANRGFAPIVFEREPAFDSGRPPTGRTINLALAARGIRALESAHVFEDIETALIPMSGRLLHSIDGRVHELPYGQHPRECIYSMSRSELNLRLYQAASTTVGVQYRFDHECIDIDPETGTLRFQTADGDRAVTAEVIFGTDGAGSALRRALSGAALAESSEDLLDHGYKELSIPPTDGWPLPPTGLHIWPRGSHMLIALPNTDGSLTATLFLPLSGDPGFEQLDELNVRAFFESQFADAVPLMPNLEQDFAANPVGILGSVHCQPWHWRLPQAGSSDRHLLLLGDAAHAIVPFHGQGLNAAFEDCTELANLIDTRGPAWSAILPIFERQRRPNTDAIAAMALENYREMRDVVRDPDFELKRHLGFDLERRHPGRFIPRYSMVMFHPEIGYAEAFERGRLQAEILETVLRLRPDERLTEADRLIEERLGPL